MSLVLLVCAGFSLLEKLIGENFQNPELLKFQSLNLQYAH